MAGFDDDVFFGFSVTAFSWVFSVLLAAVEAAVALPAVGGVAVAFEVWAVAVGAGQGDGLGDWHESILHPPITQFWFGLVSEIREAIKNKLFQEVDTSPIRITFFAPKMAHFMPMHQWI